MNFKKKNYFFATFLFIEEKQIWKIDKQREFSNVIQWLFDAHLSLPSIRFKLK